MKALSCVRSSKWLGACSVAAALSLFPNAAQAFDIYVQPSAWFFVQSGDEAVFPKKYTTHLSLSSGVVIKNSFALVAKYVLDREAASLSGGAGTSQKFASLAGGIGYHQSPNSGLFVDALVYLFPTYTESFDDDASVYYGKYGFGADVSYFVKIGAISIGPQVSIRKVEFSKIYANDTALELKTKPNFLQIKPYLAMVFSF